jgi:CRP/FNR family cyclic AMP-dependent transcriptional regulator
MQLADSLRLSAAWFHLLSAAEQARVEHDISIAHVPASAIIARKGEPANAWLGVLAGLIKVSVGNAEGKLASLTGVPAGGWIGEGTLLKHEIRRYDVVALRDSVIARLPAPTFEWLLDHSIAFNRFLLHQLNERVAQFIAKAEYARLLDLDARVARCLAELFNPLLYPGMGMRLAITQEEVGFLAGVSRQRANQALGTLEHAGLLKVEYGAVRVLDLEGLKRFRADASSNAV